jgi:hypothetical protein
LAETGELRARHGVVGHTATLLGTRANAGSAVTSDGHAYARFRRALDRRLVTQAWMAAAELQHVSLADALELSLLVLVGEPERYRRVLTRWHGRFCLETHGLEADEAALILDLLLALEGGGEASWRALRRAFECQGRHELAKVVTRWSRRPANESLTPG